MRRTVLMSTAVLVLASADSAAERDRPTALFATPIHEGQLVRGDDGKDHIEYDVLVVSVFPEPVTLVSISVLDPSGRPLMLIEGDALTAATQTLFAHTQSAIVPASAAVSVDIDLSLPPSTAPAWVTHRIAYTLKADSELAPMLTGLVIDAPEVTINRQPAIVIKPPVSGTGWLVSSGCCQPNIHRDLRIAIDGVRIETVETFAIDLAKARNNRIFDGDGSKVEQHYAFGEDVLAVADGTVVSIQDGMPETTPNIPMRPKTKDDYGGNHVLVEIAPDVFALYAHLRAGSLTVKVGDVVRAGQPLAGIGNTGPSMGPHLHFGLSDRPDFFAGRSLPFVFDSYSAVGAIDFDASRGDHLVVVPRSEQVRFAYPLYGGIEDFP